LVFFKAIATEIPLDHMNWSLPQIQGSNKTMTLTEFKSSLSKSDPPQDVNTLLLALWYDAKGSWDKAHELAQDVHSENGAWIHGYLHLKEGDKSNASYWYHRAGKKFPDTTLEVEWDVIAEALLRN
jgi:hypothetical protein